MKMNTLLVRTAALSALLVLQACDRGAQPTLAEHDPWQQYKLGSVFDCDQVGAPDYRQNYENVPTPGFGCAHQSNISAMAADPEDLQRSRALTPADKTARARVIDAYRDGQNTAVNTGTEGTQELVE